MNSSATGGLQFPGLSGTYGFTVTFYLNDHDNPALNTILGSHHRRQPAARLPGRLSRSPKAGGPAGKAAEAVRGYRARTVPGARPAEHGVKKGDGRTVVGRRPGVTSGTSGTWRGFSRNGGQNRPCSAFRIRTPDASRPLMKRAGKSTTYRALKPPLETTHDFAAMEKGYLLGHCVNGSFLIRCRPEMAQVHQKSLDLERSRSSSHSGLSAYYGDLTETASRR